MSEKKTQRQRGSLIIALIVENIFLLNSFSKKKKYFVLIVEVFLISLFLRSRSRLLFSKMKKKFGVKQRKADANIC